MMTTCDVCGKAPCIGVASVPGVAISASYCYECLKAGAHPWDILVANTVACGGLDQTNEFWHYMVEQTCRHLGKTIEQFNADVDEAMELSYGQGGMATR